MYALKETFGEVTQRCSGPGSAWVEIPNAGFYSCYFSPNGELGVYESELSELREVVLGKRKESIFCGVFNSKSAIWGV
nr:unnamed protein product [Callosobruchus analis]